MVASVVAVPPRRRSPRSGRWREGTWGRCGSVRPEQYAVAAAELAAPAAEPMVVDLHKGLPQLHRPSLDEVYERSRLARLGDVDVRILGPEDHLRYMCIHM